MICPVCKETIHDECRICPVCGANVLKRDGETAASLRAKQVNQSDMAHNQKIGTSEPQAESSSDSPKESFDWKALAGVSLACGILSFLWGCYKLIWYDNPDYGHSINAYVGGDAYNYIINGTYATAFFVLTAMFILAAIGMMGLHYLSQKK